LRYANQLVDLYFDLSIPIIPLTYVGGNYLFRLVHGSA
jgi:hypothetical protein